MNLRYRPMKRTFALSFMAVIVWLPIERAGSEGAKKAGELEDVVIKGEETQKPSITRPPLQFFFDPSETIRDSLLLDESLLMAEHPQVFAWTKTHPQLLHNQRVIQPPEALIYEEPQIRFNLAQKLAEVLGKKMDKKELKLTQWKLTIADEEGKTFQDFQGKGILEQDLVWNGRNEKGEWIQPGHAYSAVHIFTDPQGISYSIMGHPVQYKGIVRREENMLLLTLDSGVLFGADKKSMGIQPEGKKLLRSSADWVKRSHAGLSMRVRTFSQNQATALSQSNSVRDALMAELMIPAQNILLENAPAPFSEQRVELVLSPTSTK